MTSKTQRATLDDGRLVPSTRWLTLDGRSYKVTADRIEVLYAADDRGGETRVRSREIKPGTPRYRAIMQRLIKERRT
jgi:hypothetical protein